MEEIVPLLRRFLRPISTCDFPLATRKSSPRAAYRQIGMRLITTRISYQPVVSTSSTVSDHIWDRARNIDVEKFGMFVSVLF